MGGLALSVLAAEKIESDFSSVQVYYYKDEVSNKRCLSLVLSTIVPSINYVSTKVKDNIFLQITLTEYNFYCDTYLQERKLLKFP